MSIGKLNGLYFFILLCTPFLLFFDMFQASLFGRLIISSGVSAEIYFLIIIFSKFYLDGIDIKQTIHIKSVKPTILICAVACGFLLAGLKLISIYPTSATPIATVNNTSNLDISSYMFSVIIIAPICEEYVFRDIFFRNIRLHKGFIVSALVSALYFAMTHFTISQLYTATVLGIISALFYEFSQSLIPSILIHATSNCLPYILMGIAKYCPQLISWKFSSAIDKLFPILIIIALILLICSFVVITTGKKQHFIDEIKLLFAKESGQNEKIVDIFFISSIFIFIVYTIIKMNENPFL